MKTCLLILFTLFAVSLLGQRIENYYNLNDITCSYREGDTLWIGTSAGLVAWQISTQKILTHYHQGNSKLRSNSIRKVERSPNGTLWVLTGNRIMSLDSLGWHRQEFDYPPMPQYVKPSPRLDPSDQSVSTFIIDRQGLVWAAMKNEVQVYTNEKWTKMADAAGYQFFVDHQNRVWFYSDYGNQLSYIENGQLVTINDKIPTDSYFNRIHVDRTGMPWVSVRKGFLYHDGSTWKKIVLRGPGKDFSFEFPNLIFEDEGGSLWLGMENDIAVFEGGSVRLLNIYEELKEKHPTNNWNVRPGRIYDIKQQAHTHWVIFMNGIYNLHTKDWYPFSFEGMTEQVDNEYVNSYFTDDGGLLILTNRFMVKYLNGRLEKITLPCPNQLGERVDAPKVAPNGNLWLCYTKGLVKITDTGRIEYPTSFLYPFKQQLAFDKMGNTWVIGVNATSSTVLSVRVSGEILAYEIDDNNTDLQLVPCVNDSSMCLIGLTKSFIYKNQGWRKFDGCPEVNFSGSVQRGREFWLAKDSLYTFTNGEWKNQNIRLIEKKHWKESLFLDSANVIWAVTKDFKLVRFTPDNVRVEFNTSEFLNGEQIKGFKVGKRSNIAWSENFVAVFEDGKWFGHKYRIFSYQHFEDKTGNWWCFGSGRGIFKINASTAEVFEWKALGWTSPFIWGIILEDQHSKIWVVTNNGAASITPQNQWSSIPCEMEPDFWEAPVHIIEDETHDAVWLSNVPCGWMRIKGGSVTFVNKGEPWLFSDQIKNLHILGNKLFVFYDKGYSTIELY